MEQGLEKLQGVFENTQEWERLIDSFVQENSMVNTPGSDILSNQEFRFELERKMQDTINIFIKKHVKALLGCKGVVDSQENNIESLTLEITSLREENEQLNEMSLSLIKEIKRLKKYVNESDVLVSVLRGEMCKQRYQNKLFVSALKQMCEGNEEAAAETLTKAFALYQNPSDTPEGINARLEGKQKSLENSFIHSELEEDRMCQSAKLKKMLEESESCFSEDDEYNQQFETRSADEGTDFVPSHIEEGLEMSFDKKTKSEPVAGILMKQEEVIIKDIQGESSQCNKKIEDNHKKSPEIKKQVLPKWLIPENKASTLKYIKSHDEIEMKTKAIDIEDKVKLFVEKIRKEAKINTKLPFESLINMPFTGIKDLLSSFFRNNQ